MENTLLTDEQMLIDKIKTELRDIVGEAYDASLDRFAVSLSVLIDVKIRHAIRAQKQFDGS